MRIIFKNRGRETSPTIKIVNAWVIGFVFICSVFFVFYFGGRVAAGEKVVPSFVDGWYINVYHYGSVDELAREGYNSLLVYTDESTPQIMDLMLGKCRDNKIRAILGFDYRDIREAGFGKVREFVKKYKDNPVVSGWYIWDEPDIGNASPQWVEGLYNAIKGEDLKKPVYCAFGKLNCIKKFDSCFDIPMVDYYPAFDGEPEGKQNRMDTVSEVTEFCREYAIQHNRRGFIYIPQGFGYDDQGKARFYRRDPTKSEYRFMVYSSLIRKPAGVLNWAYHITNKSILKNVVYPVHKEYKGLIPVLQSGEFMGKMPFSIKEEVISRPALSVLNIPSSHDVRKIKYNYSFYKGVHYLVMVNESGASVNVSGVASGRMLFSHVFKPYDVYVYRAD
jgi:hypothetical protein